MVNNIGDRGALHEKVVITEKKVMTFLAVTCKATRDQHDLIHVAAVPRNLFYFFTVPTHKKVWETLIKYIKRNSVCVSDCFNYSENASVTNIKLERLITTPW